jgi:transcriptional regulator with PAS, ATPase and Fis domain
MHRYRAEVITVNNNFSHSDPLAIAKSIASCSTESVTIFDKRKRIIHFNNRFGTFDGAEPDDLLDLYTLFGYLSHCYINWREAMETIKRVFDDCIPREFEHKHKDGWSCYGRAWPVMVNGTLGGVVLLAHKVTDGSTLQIGECHREQLHA